MADEESAPEGAAADEQRARVVRRIAHPAVLSDEAVSAIVAYFSPERVDVAGRLQGLTDHIGALDAVDRAARTEVTPDGVWEALQRLIENGFAAGPASAEDALTVANYRKRWMIAREVARTEATKAERVLPCPFCGGPGSRIYVSPNGKAKAVGCGVGGCCQGPWAPNSGTDDAANALWNFRADRAARTEVTKAEPVGYVSNAAIAILSRGGSVLIYGNAVDTYCVPVYATPPSADSEYQLGYEAGRKAERGGLDKACDIIERAAAALAAQQPASTESAEPCLMCLSNPRGHDCGASDCPASPAEQASPPDDAVNREFLGKIVRMVWIEWAREQPQPKASWLTPWEGLTEPEREVDRRIGERIASVARINHADRRSRAETPTPAKAVELPPHRGRANGKWTPLEQQIIGAFVADRIAAALNARAEPQAAGTAPAA